MSKQNKKKNQMGGALYVISAPSGAGKTSLVKALIAGSANTEASISYTTREMRPGEKDGVDYHFISHEQFQSMVKNGEFLEYAEVFGEFYGTGKQNVAKSLAHGQDVILEIDWQGGRQIRQKMPESCSIFILPPSKVVLDQRLRERGQDNQEVIRLRMNEAVKEISHYNEYDYCIINDDFETALEELKIILRSRRLKLEFQQLQYASLLRDLLEK